ncbi:YveK family protein [Christensenella intestinihominis]|uniref:YveK family protein n=1 Tax=Christensenella intestinihominis TaxID=1851429 RepID=UPI000832F0CB|nr:Wzz/FepE/Etk N-terminal domain-containing protein [Christensenella intestinihominis]
MEFTIRDVGKMLKKSWIIVVALTILAGIAGYFVSEYVIDKKYEATAMMIVSSTNTGSETGSQMTINDYNLNTKLVNSYSVLCKSEKVLSQVEDKLNIDTGKKDLSQMIAVSAKSDTDIINISVTDTSPQFAQEVANTLVDVFQQEVTNIMKMDNVQVIDYATVPNAPSSPNVMLNTAVAALVGLIIGLIIAVLRYILDDTVKDVDSITEIMDVPVIGNIPKFN